MSNDLTVRYNLLLLLTI